MNSEKANSSKRAQKDPRKGLPSASAIQQLAPCPGALQAQASIPEPPPGADSAIGTRIHTALETDMDLADHDEQAVVEICRRLTNELIEDLLNPENCRRLYEQRWWLTEDGVQLCSGRADLVVLDEPRALIIDYKTGRNAAPASARNLQLRTLAVLLKERLPHINEVFTAVVQPWCRCQTNGCRYTDLDLEDARDQIVEICQKALEPGAKRKAGMQCEWCRAKAVCPEALDQAMAVTAPMGSSPNKALDLVGNMSGDKLAELMPKIDFAERVFKAVRAEIRGRLEVDPNAVPGYRLKTIKPRTVITDLPLVAARLGERGVDLEQFSGACTITLKNVETLLRTTGLKGSGLAEALEQSLEGATAAKHLEPRLERVT